MSGAAADPARIGTMRRFSQRNALVTLSDINITPLLDLAFVLLIIFVIISPSIRSTDKHGMELRLPEGGGQTRKVDPRNIRIVEISPRGEYMLSGVRMGLPQVERELVKSFQANPQLVVRIRCDQEGLNKHTYAVIHMCQQNGITNFQLDTASKRPG